MRRRDFVALLGGVAAWPLPVLAQQRGQTRRVGILLPATADDAVWQDRLGAFLQGLGLLGWTIGQPAHRHPLGHDQCRRNSQTRGRIGCACA